MENKTTKRVPLTTSTFKGLWMLLLAMALFACNEDDVAPKPKPTIDKVEIGLKNNKIGIIGRDFHFYAEVVAGETIEAVKINIKQRNGESYAKVWSFEIVWEDFKGTKNSVVHKHFNIPNDAAEGKYDFIVTVTDENGTKSEVTSDFEVIDPAKLPVTAALLYFAVEKIDVNGNTGFSNFYANENFVNVNDKIFRKNEAINSVVQIENVKGDGKMYLLLIRKSLNHKPETVAEIDFSKVIVADVLEHKGLGEVVNFDNYFIQVETPRNRPTLKIGATNDNNLPASNAIEGAKAWESGAYYFGVVYTNTTHKLSTSKYIEFDISY